VCENCLFPRKQQVSQSGEPVIITKHGKPVVKVSVLPITPEIAARAASFPESYPKDPQDRLIGATALVEGAGLVTHDRGIAKSRLVPVIG
jgi:PIN domain nuclease of toxin-antitoxin system